MSVKAAWRCRIYQCLNLGSKRLPFLRMTLPSLAFKTAYLLVLWTINRDARNYKPQKPLSRPIEKQDLSSLNVTERTLLGWEGWIL